MVCWQADGAVDKTNRNKKKSRNRRLAINRPGQILRGSIAESTASTKLTRISINLRVRRQRISNKVAGRTLFTVQSE